MSQEIGEENNLEEMVAVRTAIDGLPFQERNVILLQYYHDCNICEIAAITNATIPITKYRLRRAKAKLQKMLGG